MMEIIIALSFLATAALAFIQLNEEQQDRARAGIAAQNALTVGQAMQSFINDRYAELLTRATDTRPALITVGDLVGGGYLPAGSTGLDAYGLTLCTLVLQVPGTPMPRLQGLMVAEGDGPPRINDVDLGRVVSGVGGAGGGLYTATGTAPGVDIRGAGGAWAVPAGGPFANANDRGLRCDGANGTVALVPGRYMVALWYGKVFNNEDVLYTREVPGRADLNTMRTPLGLFVDATGEVAFGRPCTQVGQIATDANGVALTCRADGTGAPHWGNSYFVDQGGSLVRFGQACALNGSYATDASGVPMVCKGGIWGVFSYVDSSGAAGVGAGRTCSATLAGAIAADASGTLLSCKAGFWVVALPEDGGAAPGAACVVNGSMATGSSGLPFICVAGHWKAMDGSGVVRDVAFTSSGSFTWPVPPGVRLVWLTMAGGGESGVPPAEMAPNDDLPYSAWWTQGGDSGAFIQRHPVTVTPGSELCITVGRGGAMVPAGSYHNWVMAAKNPGTASSVRACGGGLPSEIRCPGGGQGSACNVQPTGHGRGVLLESSLALSGFDNVGGKTPFASGAGGGTQVIGCGFGCSRSKNRSYGQPGSAGAVFLSWTE